MWVAVSLAVSDHLTTKRRAIEDAKTTQVSILRECASNGTDPPPYELIELIGKGSFGRVYKATASSPPRQLFAIKIISIEEGDIHQPGAADTFNDVLKEVNTLKLLRSGGAKNINNIVDALLVGQSVWMITELCAGGSVASLMRPTSGLPERWMIPILREVAEALRWVHQEGLIHRDVKCANVFVTESGDVQLGDFGVAGIIQSKSDKRTTVTGTIPWMAPELFDPTVSYGCEVDIWAFGAMAYEMATGLPPNATKGIDVSEFGSYLKSHCPRLEGDQHSSQLKDLVAFCMVEDPAQRPLADNILAHPLLFDTSTEYPTASLAGLVQAYKSWEAQGGSRHSLFTAGGAQGLPPDPFSALNDQWDFDTVDLRNATAQDNISDMINNAYSAGDGFETPRPTVQAPRRRRPPANLKAFKVPLQRVFDANTMSKYDDNSRAFYRRTGSLSELPLTDTAAPRSARESLIDLDASFEGRGSPAQTFDDETIRYRPRSSDGAEHHRPRTQDWTFPLVTPPTSASTDGSGDGAEHLRPRTQDWTFPLLVSATSVSPEGQRVTPSPSHFSTPTDQNRASTVSLVDLDASYVGSLPSPPNAAPQSTAWNRVSTASLIDLDAAVAPSPTHSYTTSDAASLTSETPFSLETPPFNKISFNKISSHSPMSLKDSSPNGPGPAHPETRLSTLCLTGPVTFLQKRAF